jgi:P-type conjugative transfer protein TrbJ
MTNSSSNSTADRLVPKHPPRRRRLLTAVFIATGAALVFLPARRADAFLFDIVLDPVALVENVLKVVDLGEQIDAVVQQVENEIKELEHLNLSDVPNIAGIISGVEGQLNSSLYSTPNPADQLDTRYPANMSNATWAQYQSDQSTWTDNQRQTLVENRQLQNQIYQDMDTTTQQVQDIVDASNSASGETSAIQAHNDLLAVASGEMAKLQSLRVARSRLKTEKLAQQQSESSFAEAERQRVRTGWDNPAPPAETVVDPFQN